MSGEGRVTLGRREEEMDRRPAGPEEAESRAGPTEENGPWKNGGGAVGLRANSAHAGEKEIEKDGLRARVTEESVPNFQFFLFCFPKPISNLS